MKIRHSAAAATICLAALSLSPALCGQTPPGMAPLPLRQPGLLPGAPVTEPGLTRFNLDFAGGTPQELVAAIEKAMKRPLNAIIPEELAATKLPALKLNSVDVAQLFQALAAASRKSETVASGRSGFGGPPGYSIMNTSYGFRQGSEGRPSDDTIWYFYVEKPSLPPPAPTTKVCQFYPLGPYLDHGLTVDDITTAIETGWKMLGETTPPTISFHKDTKLLIAVGEPNKLEIIDAVLKALAAQTSSGRAEPAGRLTNPNPGK